MCVCGWNSCDHLNCYHRFLSLSIQTLFGNLIYWFNISYSFIILRYIFPSSFLWIAFVQFFFHNSCFCERNWFYRTEKNRKMERKRNRNDVILLHRHELVFCEIVDFFSFVIKIMKIRLVNWSSIRVTSSCLDKHLLD